MPTSDVTDAHGARYTPWSNGWAIGYKVEKPGHDTEFIYFNPSSESDDEVSNVFVYHGTAGAPDVDEPLVHVDLFNDAESQD